MSFPTRIAKWVFSPVVLVSLAVVFLVVVIWFDFPLLAIGDKAPFESEASRGWLIAVLLLCWLVWLAWRIGFIAACARGIARLRAQWAARAEAAKASRGSVSELQLRFVAALQVLRRGYHKTTSRRKAWLARLTRRYVYHWPWYVVVGTSQAGKTALLRQVGLELKAAGSQPEATAALAPTSECDWWLGDKGVLIDTPGSFVDGGSEDLPAHAGWSQLLGLLKKHRAHQPLNGVLIAIGADELLQMSGDEVARFVTRLRTQLLKMQQIFGIQVPAYVVVTKMDLLAGFTEYFSGLNSDDRKQVWGLTFAVEAAGAPSSADFNARFDELVQRLYDGLPEMLDAEADLDHRHAIYLFPQQFASLRPVVQALHEALSRQSQFDAHLLVRGVYFTSAMRGPALIDRVLSSVRSRLQIIGTWGARGPALPDVPHFVRRLCDDVVFPEATLAGVSVAQRRRQWIWHSTALTGLGITLFGLVGLWLHSFDANRAFLAEVDTHVAHLQQYGQRPLDLNAGDVLALEPLLSSAQALPDSRVLDIHDPSLVQERMGFYQGNRVALAADSLYRRALIEKVLPLAAARVHDILAADSGDDIEYSYDALKAYLMLYDKTRFDPTFLAAWLSVDLESGLTGAESKPQRARLNTYLADLMTLGPLTSPYPIDNKRVASARERLLRYSFVDRAYHRLRRVLLKEMPDGTVNIAQAGGPQASLVLARKSGLPLTDGVADFYTANGYWHFVDKRIPSERKKLAADDVWVLGVGPVDEESEQSGEKLDDAIRREYFHDFIDKWDAYLNDLTIVTSTSATESMQIARTLSAPDSPLKLFLQTVARDTDLESGHAPRESARPNFVERNIDEVRKSMQQMFVDNAASTPWVATDRPERIVDDHFEPLRRLVSGSGPDGNGPAPIDSSLRGIADLYNYLVSVNAAVDSGNPPPATDVFDRLQAEAGRTPMPLQAMIDQVAKTDQSQVGGIAKRDMDVSVSSSVGALCRQTIAGRYPFARHASREVAPGDFARMFAPGGLMDDFYQKNLAHGVAPMQTDTVSFDATPGARLMASFRNAAIIRDVFFSSNASTPSYGFSISPLDLDTNILQYTLSVGGQTLRYAHGPQLPVTMQWPGSHSQVVSLQVTTQKGTTGLQTQGLWALQHMFDKARIERQRGSDSFIATFDVDGHTLSFLVTANSANTPFFLPQMSAFACPS
jgi:type VI secretion system protein ImpL